MKNLAGRWPYAMLLMLLSLTVAIPVFAQDTSQNSASQAPGQAVESNRPASSSQYAPGKTATIEGVIEKRDPDGITVRTRNGSIEAVALSGATEVRERKSNPFRRARNYATTQLLPGLAVEVKGHGGSNGSLVADQIRFTDDDLRLATLFDSRVTPVENRLGQNEQNALRLSGQVSELSAVSNAARGGAKAAQETADTALESAKGAMDSAKRANDSAEVAKEGVHAANERITALDDYDVRGATTVNFKAGSSILSAEAKEGLDKIAEQTKIEKGYLVEVSGFASSDGNADYNRTLSQRRADAVIRYLAESHSIPLRRFITPFGYGALQPVADNKTHSGRVQNRRVEVHVLVSKGLVPGVSTTASR